MCTDVPSISSQIDSVSHADSNSQDDSEFDNESDDESFSSLYYRNPNGGTMV